MLMRSPARATAAGNCAAIVKYLTFNYINSVWGVTVCRDANNCCSVNKKRRLVTDGQKDQRNYAGAKGSRDFLPLLLISHLVLILYP